MRKLITITACVTGVVLLQLSVASKAAAQSGVWTNEVDGLWSQTSAWLDGVVANGEGNTAAFSNQASATVMVTLDSPRTIGHLHFLQGTYTLTNDGPLTLAGPTKPVIYVPAGNTATIRRTIMAGTNGFILDGGGILNFYKGGTNWESADPSNTWTGTLILSNGTLQVQGDDVTAGEHVSPALNNSLGALESVTFYNGSTLNLRADPSTLPSHGWFNGNLIVPEGHSGTIVLPVRFSGAAGNGGAVGGGLGGTLTGSGTLTVRPKYIRGNIVGDWSGFTGQIDVAPDSATGGADEFRFGNVAGFPNAVVNLSGTITFTARHYPALSADTVIPIGLLIGDNANAFLAGSETAAYTLFFDIGAKQTDPSATATFRGSIVNGAGPAGIIWRGAGTWQLTGNSTYTGPTIISNGVVVIGDGWSESGSLGSGPITNYSRLVFDRGGTLWVQGGIHGPGSLTNANGINVLAGISTYSGPTRITGGKLELGTGSTLPGSFTVADGAALGVRLLTPNGRVAIGSLSFGSGCALDYEFFTNVNPTVTVMTNLGNLSMNGNVTVNISGSALSVGTIVLLEYGSRSGSGTFVLGGKPPHVTSANITDDTLNKRVILNITAVFDPTLVWVGDAAGVWDVGNPANLVWKVAGSGAATYYTDGSMVRFDDTATGTTTINVSSAVSPASVTVNNTTKTYTFGGSGAISGTGLFTKRGSGMVTINTAGNNWSGGLWIESGTVRVGDGTAAATIVSPGPGPITNDGALVFNSAAANTISAVIRGTGAVIQNGPGELTLSGANLHTGGVEVGPGATYIHNNFNAIGGSGATLRLNRATLSMLADSASGNPVIILGDSAIMA
ncbi:MAG: autotransporter-associated beta strand repeat-containing protein, partial [Verrucomicrobiae bacterium]|nr:autotransporter-associated beta strand repeat-containing protein [Verrucomicrobiae bacterium]